MVNCKQKLRNKENELMHTATIDQVATPTLRYKISTTWAITF